TQQPVLVLGCSGTGGVEAAMLNTLTPDDRVMVFDNGRFAKRWALMLSSLGIPCIRIPVTPGLPVTEDIVVESLRRNPGCSAVWVVHCETSTGTVSDIRTVASAVREHSDALMCVDAVSSIGVHELRMDAWALDVVVASSQKGLTSPAGLAVVSLSDRAWMRARSLERNRTMYFDLMAARAAYERNRTPWTPAMLLVIALDTSLGLLIDEGLPQVWERHGRTADIVRNSLLDAGFTLFSASPADALTAVFLPDKLPDIVDRLKIDYGITVARGQDALARSIFRIGHIGPYIVDDVAFVAGACRSLLHST
ncbi:MAG: pyridoxal-phosphate-dependent aminotransferase family protein, partial [Candidatus Kapaibacterium sp.]